VTRPGRIERAILLIRGQKVLLDEDLAELYEVETKRLNEAVRRNIERFPSDFMFQRTREEWESLRSQIATLEEGRGQHRKYLPYAFTEQGVAMLSSVLRSPRAVQVNIEIMRAFVRLRQFLASHEELARKVAEMDQQLQSGGDGEMGRRGAMVLVSLSPCLLVTFCAGLRRWSGPCLHRTSPRPKPGRTAAWDSDSLRRVHCSSQATRRKPPDYQAGRRRPGEIEQGIEGWEPKRRRAGPRNRSWGSAATPRGAWPSFSRRAEVSGGISR
jgi:hypothetical protein